MEESPGHNGLYARQYEKYTAICYNASVIAAHYYLVCAEKVKAVGAPSDGERKNNGNQYLGFGTS